MPTSRTSRANSRATRREQAPHPQSTNPRRASPAVKVRAALGTALTTLTLALGAVAAPAAPAEAWWGDGVVGNDNHSARSLPTTCSVHGNPYATLKAINPNTWRSCKDAGFRAPVGYRTYLNSGLVSPGTWVPVNGHSYLVVIHTL